MNVRRFRRGLTLVELCATCALLAAAIPLSIAALGAVAGQRRGVELRQKAIETADNLLERLAAEPFDSLSAQRLAEFAKAAAPDRVLPGGELKFALAELPAPPAGKRIDVELSWQPGAARVRQRVRLSGWAFREAAP